MVKYADGCAKAAEKEQILVVAALCFVSPPETGLFRSLSPVRQGDSRARHE